MEAEPQNVDSAAPVSVSSFRRSVTPSHAPSDPFMAIDTISGGERMGSWALTEVQH